MDPLLSILCVVVRLLDKVRFGLAVGSALKIEGLGRKNDGDEKASEPFGAMDDWAENSLVNRVSCGVNKRERGIRVTIGLTFNMPPNRTPTCIQLSDEESI